jgi:hypothetical protein
MSGAKEEGDLKNPLEMSDEDFLKLGEPSGNLLGSSTESGEGNDTTSGSGDATESGADPKASGDDGDGGADSLDGSGSGESTSGEGSTLEGAETLEGASKPGADSLTGGEGADTLAGDPEGKGKPAPKSGAKVKAPADTIVGAAENPAPVSGEVMASFYQRVVNTPLKANGKTIKINTPEEAIGLMQMGANYTRKLQDLAPHRKAVAMLEKNGLLDEGKLAFLIDISLKNPDAIKKLVKESGLDPRDMDIEADSVAKYTPGNHGVSDTEIRFRTAMDDLKSSQEGKATLATIHTDWDDASKDLLWENPEVLSIIHEQRENGVYARISAEVDRQKTLGIIQAEVPFLHAYKQVGDALAAAAAAEAATAPKLKATPGGVGQGGKPTGPVVAAARPALPKPVAANNDKARAASGSRTMPNGTGSGTGVNPLAMSDDDFIKQFAGRL